MITEDKVTELFCIADDFCKFFDAMMSKYTIKEAKKRAYHRDSTLSMDWVNIVTGGSGDTGRGDTEITFEDTVLEFVLTEKSMELLEQNKFQVVGHGFDLLKVTIE